jgi:hypothetical protein
MKRVYGLIYSREYKKFINLCLLVLILFSQSCNEDREKRFTVCDCTGTQLEEFADEEGVVASTAVGYRIISGTRGYVKDCIDLPDAYKKHGLLVRTSGKNIESCHTMEPNFNRYINNVELNSLDSIEDIKVIGRVKIEIFYSINDGGVSGWGYILKDTVRDFNIRQNEIPAKSGWEQFKTPREAWVVAVLIAYKMNYSGDLPDFEPDAAFLGY